MKRYVALALIAVLAISSLTAGAAVRFRQEPGISVWGLSTDTKPFVTQRGDSLAAGTIFTETDTGKKWIFNGSAWSEYTVSAVTDTTRLSAPGYTAAVSCKGYSKATWYFTVSNINSAVAMVLQARRGNSGWFNCVNDSTRYTENGSYGLTWNDVATADSLRGRWISEGGGTDAQILSNFGLSGQ